MKRLFLIYGNPGSGKTSLAEYLRSNHSFEILSLDDLYIEFVKEKCPDFYFEKLRNYINQHYHHILNNGGYTKEKFGRDFVNEWHEYLFATTIEWSATHDNLVVEGYLLIDCLSDLETRMSQIAQVFLIYVSDHSYRVLGTPMSANDVAILGQTDENTA